MAVFSVLSGVPNPLFDQNGDPASGFVLKAFLPGGTDALSIAIDSAGSSPQATITYNAEGQLEVTGNEILPYIDRKSKWGVFRNAADATANTPFFLGPFDNVEQILDSLTASRLFIDTVALMIADLNLSIGNRVQTSGYTTINGGGANLYEIVAGGTGTPDPGSFIDLTGTGLQAKGLFPDGVVRALQFGPTTAGLQAALDFSIAVDFGDGVFALTEPLNINTNKQVVHGQHAQFSFDASYNTVGGTILKMFEVQAVSDVEIYGIDFDMTPPVAVTGGGSFGIRYLTGCARGAVHHCIFKNQESVSLASVTSASGSFEIDVHHNIFFTDSLSFGGGAILHSGNRCHADNNICINLGDTYISLDDTESSTCNDNIFANKLLDGAVLRASGTVVQVAQGSVGCIVDGNTFFGISVVGIFIFDSIGNIQQKNIISNNNMNGGGVSNPAQASVFILADGDSSGIDIHGNKIFNASGTGAGSFGIQVRNRNVRVFGNDVDATGMTRGIQVSFDATANEYIHVFDNQVKALSQGIQFSAGDYNNTMQLHCYDNNIEDAIEGLKVDATNFIPKIMGNTFKGTTGKTAGTWQFNVFFNTHDSDERPGSAILETGILLWDDGNPTSGTWTIGDEIRNKTPVVAGSASSQYTIQAWTRITTGTGNVLNTDWVEARSLTGT